MRCPDCGSTKLLMWKHAYITYVVEDGEVVERRVDEDSPKPDIECPKCGKGYYGVVSEEAAKLWEENRVEF